MGIPTGLNWKSDGSTFMVKLNKSMINMTKIAEQITK